MATKAKPLTDKAVEAAVLKWTGHIRIIIRRAGVGSKVVEVDNLITDAGRALLALALRDGAALPELSFMAWGTGATAPAAGDVLLDNEAGRKQVTSQVAGTTPNKTVTTTYIAPGEGNIAIAELGWFAGPATDVEDTGTLVARVLWSHTKTEEESIQVERTDTIA